MLDYIKKLIAEGEHQQLDFKFEINDSRKIARSISAFANTLGGRLLIGVKDNGRISGVRSDEEYYMIESAAHLFCKPQVDFKAARWNVDGRSVLEIKIEKAIELPVYVKEEDGKWVAYSRVKDSNVKASSVQMLVWKRKRKNKGTFVQISDVENKLLKYLENTQEISLAKTIKLLHITKKEAESVLVNLICFDVIEMFYGQHGTLYKLREIN